ncbi:hyaluronate lyase [Paenibacillus donghaensis]|uniref:polysaccharide lyase family 8 super-sandwich domain-containing protein n=1 Tax=Paenibacillus donghaensis TaxID=414771 RepID=UPI0018844555|nr:polysaccharide lyase family 8 super-sandwich domain-containing protein [Paenibacillus donghaensis]MBE9918163.1 hyaluronate lyase [Paenibacillus donghaensis]
MLAVSLLFLMVPSEYLGGSSQKVQAEAANLVNNGGFEQTTATPDASWNGITSPASANWGLWIPTGSGKAPNQTAKVYLDTATYHEGQQSMAFDAFQTSRVSINQSVTKIAAGKSYRLKMWVKTESVIGTGAYFRTQFYNTSKVGDGPVSAQLLGTNDWTLQQVYMTIPSGVTKLVIEPFLETGTGKVWFDDISLEEYNGITALALDQKAVTMAIGDSQRLGLSITPADAADKSVVWSSSDPNVVTVDADGNLSGVGVGTAAVTVTTPDGIVKAECLVNVESAETAAAYRDLRLKWQQKLTGGPWDGAKAADPDIHAAVDQLDQSVANDEGSGFWDLLNKADNRTYLWSDLKSATDSSQISSAYGRLRTMAVAYSTQDSRFYQNAELRDAIIRGLDWLYVNRYNENKSAYGNWWDWEIGTPQILNDVVILMYDQLTQQQKDKYMKAVDTFCPDPKTGTVLGVKGVKMTGANLLDKALVVTMRGVIGNNSAKIAQGRDSIGPEFVYATHGDGVYKDGSLVQHANIAYTAGYGAVWLSRAADMTYLLNGSPWPVTDPNVNNVYNWVKDTFEPVIYKGLYMDMVNGRGISREGSGSARGTIVTLLRLAEGAPADVAASIKSRAKEWISKDTTYENYYKGLSIYELTLVKQLMNDANIQPRGELIKSHVFAGMDRVVHLRDGYGFGLSLFSNRISAFEKGNNENVKGWYTGIGMTYLYDNDLMQYRDGYWPTVNSFRLPGTTTDGSGEGAVPGEWKAYMNAKSWVGGATIDNLYSAAGMDFSLSQVTGSNLHGKKSWFMFDNEIVALGAGISSNTSGPKPVETIIDNRKLNPAGDNALTVNGIKQPGDLGWSDTMSGVKWAHLAGNVPGSDMGYYFPDAPTLYGLRESRTGSWSEINSGQSKTPITRNYASLAFEHGNQPDNASYAYILLPGKDAKATQAYSENPKIKILSNTDQLQAIEHKALDIIAANFWTPGKAGFISAQNPASVMLKEVNGEISLAVSDPTQQQSKITIELHKQGLTIMDQDEAIKVSETKNSTIIEVNVGGSIGKTHVVKFSKGSVKH